MAYNIDILKKGFMSKVYGDRPSEKSSYMLNDLIGDNKTAFVVGCTQNGYLLEYINNKEDNFIVEDWIEKTNTGTKNSEKIKIMLEEWKRIIQINDKKTHVVIFPRIPSDYYSLFNQIRHDIHECALGASDITYGSFVFITDYPTLTHASVERGEYSSLVKEFIPHIYFFEGIEQYSPGIQWLTDCQCDFNRAFYKLYTGYIDTNSNKVSQYKDIKYIVRDISHVLVSELLMATSTSAFGTLSCGTLTEHLCDLLNIHSPEETSEFNLKVSHLLTSLYNLLPGTYSKEDPHARHGWPEQKHNARWKPYSLLRPAQQALLMGGFIRYNYEPGKTQFRITNPLLTYTVARYAMERNHWQPDSKPTYEALRRPHREYVEPNTPPTSLDLFLDLLLNKAVYDEDDDGWDGELDHWTVPKLDEETTRYVKDATADLKRAGNLKPGEWWKRLPEPSFD